MAEPLCTCEECLALPEDGAWDLTGEACLIEDLDECESCQ